ncbi:MAG: porin [Planctomycetaceae bacterium]|nr:porin [Planctomycetaceae bacterium]
MKKLILSTLGTLWLVSASCAVHAQEWNAMPTGTPWPEVRQVSGGVPQFPPQRIPPPPQMVPPPPQMIPAPPQYYSPAPSYAADQSYSELTQRIENLERELAKKSDKPDPKKGFTAPKIGGRLFMDSVNILNQDNIHGHNYFGIRDARLGVSGSAYDFLDYQFELGFENENGANFKDAFLGIKYVPVLGYVRVGNQEVEDGCSEVYASLNYTFMEPPAPAADQFTARRLGITSRHFFAKNRVRLFLGAFGAKNISGKHQQIDCDQGIILNARLIHALMFQKDGRKMFFYGGYYSFTESNDPQKYAGVRPGSWGLMGDSPTLLADNIHKAGFETVYQNGPFCLQTDLFVRYFSDAATSSTNGDATLYGGFVMGRYFLTRGDYRKYNLESGRWSSVVVNCPFLLSQRGSYNFLEGPGAWEVAAYYGFLNNDDFENIAAVYGMEHQIGAALNWYWNPQLKWALNYVHFMADNNVSKPSVDAIGLSCRLHW